MITIELPWPPAALSPNARKHWRALAPIKAKYRQDCRYAALAARAGVVTGRHHLIAEFVPPNARHLDRDNLLARIKSGIDGMADALGINDREFDPVTVTLAGPSKAPCVRITLTPIDQLRAKEQS